MQVGDVLLLKSGSEFREFSVLTVKSPSEPGGRPEVNVMRCEVTQDDTPDKDVLAIVQTYLSKVSQRHWQVEK